MFIEKPLSCSPLEEVNQPSDIIHLDNSIQRLKLLQQNQTKPKKRDWLFQLDTCLDTGEDFCVDIFLMLSELQQSSVEVEGIDREYGPPKAFNARYNCAYSTLSKPMW